MATYVIDVIDKSCDNERLKEHNNVFPFTFRYGTIKQPIKLSLRYGELSAEIHLSGQKQPDQIFTEKNNCFSEALKKGMLFHLLIYSEPLSAKDTSVTIDGKKADPKEWKAGTDSPVINSIIIDKLNPALSLNWRRADKVYKYFLENPKSKQDELAASLYAFLCSRSKKNESERFFYLWMSMNGLYNFLAGKYKEKLKKKIQEEKGISDKEADKELKNIPLGSDNNKILLLEKAELWGKDLVTRNERPDLADKMESILKEGGYENANVEELLKEGLSLKSGKKEPEVSKDIKKEAYLNLWYPYYLRCNLFHANQPLPLFSMEKEVEIRRLRFFNARLNNYLDQHLWQYFNEDHYDKKLDRLITDKDFRGKI